MILSSSDFENGETKISQNQFNLVNFNTYLTEEKENSYIKDIFGTTLGQALIDDLAGDPSTPTDAKWQTIFNFFSFDESGLNQDCIGIKDILKYLFYHDFVSGQNILNQSGGNSSVRIESSNPEGLIKRSTVIYNRAVDNICTIQYYVSQDSVSYPDYYGKLFYLESPI